MSLSGLFSFVFGYLAILIAPYNKYRVMVEGNRSQGEREYIRKFYRDNIITTLVIYIFYAVGLYFIFRDHGQNQPGWGRNVWHWTWPEMCNFAQGSFFGLMVIYTFIDQLS